MKYFKTYTRQHILSLTKIRRFETKLGERIQTLTAETNIEDQLMQSSAKYVLIGIPEDMGVLANEGIGGTDTAWNSFLPAFCNIQSNDFLEGSQLLLLGYFDFSDLKFLIENNAHAGEEKINAYRHAVNTMDDAIADLIKLISAQQKIPIVIGGGHNNAYPLIKGAAKGLYSAGKIPLAQINCINLDAHADYRPLEGRHSGNAFRYAEEDGYLQKYCVLGIHENYLPQNVWMDIVNNVFMDCITYEDIFLHAKRTFTQAVDHAIGFTEDNYCGIEFDLDSIQNIISSAETPSGISVLQARQYINYAATDCNVAYLHLTEGAAQLANGRTNPTIGKLLSYFVADFVKAKID